MIKRDILFNIDIIQEQIERIKDLTFNFMNNEKEINGTRKDIIKLVEDIFYKSAFTVLLLIHSNTQRLFLLFRFHRMDV